ncbi:MAG TPA: oligosaccharide flippase family protein [Stellaceae bacterium]|nr:oligosaccharide flippase family protein [Stellaceae bacterium]
MVESPADPLLAALRPYLNPALRHAGWFGFFLLLAPAMGPRGYGMFILALSGIAIAEALLAETAIAALVGLAGLEERHVSTALVTVLAAGAGLTLVLRAVAGALGGIVDAAAFDDIFPSLTLLPVLGALAVVPTALLRRAGRRAPFAAATAAGTAAGGAVAVALAWAGAGPWALVAQIIVQRLCECAVLWAMAGERVGVAWSRRHFAELFGAAHRRVFDAVLPAASRYGPCLAVGLSLGPIAAGLYMLASRLAEAVLEIFLARPASLARDTPPEIARLACRALLPAALASALLPIVVPPLLDPRWWGAVPPAQILLLAALPAAIGFMRTACGENPAAKARWQRARWQRARVVGGIAAAALAAPYGLAGVAAAMLAPAALVAAAGLRPIGRRMRGHGQAALVAAARPCAGAAAAAFVLAIAADPLGRLLDPLTAFCLLTASGWLCCLLVRDALSGAAPAPLALSRQTRDPSPA